MISASIIIKNDIFITYHVLTGITIHFWTSIIQCIAFHSTEGLYGRHNKNVTVRYFTTFH